MSGGKEIAAAMVMMSLSFKVMLTLAWVYNYPLESWEDEIVYQNEEVKRYKEEGIGIVPKGCEDKCGDVSIRYPFGIGPNRGCYLNKWFLINCTKSSNGAERPFLSSFSGDDRNGGREILHISIFSERIVVKEPISTSACQTTGTGSNNNNNTSIIENTKLSQTPFAYSASYNTFLIFGCGGAFLRKPGEEFKQIGCTLNCSSSSKTTHHHQLLIKTADDCRGINCCQLPFDDDVQTYNVNFTSTEEDSASVKACNYAFFFGGRGSTLPHSLQRFPSRQQQEAVVVPVVWAWTITKDDFPYFTPSFIKDYCRYRFDRLGDSYYYFSCFCQFPEGGNAYLTGGCKSTPL